MKARTFGPGRGQVGGERNPGSPLSRRDKDSGQISAVWISPAGGRNAPASRLVVREAPPVAEDGASCVVTGSSDTGVAPVGSNTTAPAVTTTVRVSRPAVARWLALAAAAGAAAGALLMVGYSEKPVFQTAEEGMSTASGAASTLETRLSVADPVGDTERRRVAIGTIPGMPVSTQKVAVAAPATRSGEDALPLTDGPVKAVKPAAVRPPAASGQLAADEVPIVVPAAGSDGIGPQALIGRGDAFLALSDVTSARLFYQRAANGGSMAGALAMAGTFDPLVLARDDVRGARPDPLAALAWYRTAADLGSAEGTSLAERLLDRLKRDAANGDAGAAATLRAATPRTAER
ncbi:MAG: sel1 repeat family protein [Rhodospirillales bacterium]|nr:sel1 repeat family protein [Rhodospirillales bacterium]